MQPDPSLIELYPDKIQSGVDSWRSFRTSAPWLDIESWLKERLEILKNEALNAEDIEQLRGLQGASDMVVQILLLPETFILYLTEDQDE